MPQHSKDSGLSEIFVQDVREAIKRIEPVIKGLKTTGINEDALDKIFRQFHATKGSAGFLNLTRIVNVLHSAESVLDLTLQGHLKLKPAELCDIFLMVLDFLKNSLPVVAEECDDGRITEEAQAVSGKLLLLIPKDIAEPEQVLDDKKVSDNTSDVPSDIAAQFEDTVIEFNEDLLVSEEDPAVALNMKKIFIEESEKLLRKFEQDLKLWEKSPGDKKLVGELLRTIHSFKGNCGILGYPDLETLAKAMEGSLDVVAAGTVPPAPNLFKTLFTLKGVLSKGVDSVSNGGDGSIVDLEAYIDTLK